MSQTMRAAWIETVGGPLRFGELPRPTPEPDQVLLAVRAAGVCHTDLHLLHGVPTPPPLPLVPGHEIAGDVVALGSDVDGLKSGDRVLAYYYQGCQDCAGCRTGEENLCPAPKAKWGFDTNGGYAEFVTVSARCCVPLPDGVAYADAAVSGCSGTTALHAVGSIAQVLPAETVVVVGVGGIGLAVTQAAVLAGADVIAVDPHQPSLDCALRLGAKEAVCSAVTNEVLAAVADRTAGAGADVAIDTVGTESTPAMCVDLLRPAGRAVLIGYTGRPATVAVDRIVTREVVVRGSVGATLADAHEVVRLTGDGKLRAVIADRYSLADADRALRALAAGDVVGRIVLEP